MTAVLSLASTAAGDAEDARSLGDAPLLTRADHFSPSVFRPENMLREARRQKGLPPGSVPEVCALDPDGDIVAYVRAERGARRSEHWACYHTRLWEWDEGGTRLGVVGSAVGGSFAVLVAEQLFVSGCKFLVSVTSAGQITECGEPPYHIVIDRALRDEGTSYHYLPPSTFAEADPAMVALAVKTAAELGCAVEQGATWTTDAPFRETAEAIDLRRQQGILAVEMEAAALYAFAQRCSRPVLCLALVTNSMGQIEGDFEKGEANGACHSLSLVAALGRAWIDHRRTEVWAMHQDIRPTIGSAGPGVLQSLGRGVPE